MKKLPSDFRPRRAEHKQLIAEESPNPITLDHVRALEEHFSPRVQALLDKMRRDRMQLAMLEHFRGPVQ